MTEFSFQIQIPLSGQVRRNRRLEEEGGKSNAAALKTFQKEMEGAALEAGFRSPEEATAYIQEMREKRT